jgi:hypothetical protein
LRIAAAKPLRLFLPIKQRALRVQGCVGGIGIAIKSRVARIERYAAGGWVHVQVRRVHEGIWQGLRNGSIKGTSDQWVTDSKANLDCFASLAMTDWTYY